MYMKTQREHMCPHLCVCGYQGVTDSVAWWESKEPVSHSQIRLGQDAASQHPGSILRSKDLLRLVNLWLSRLIFFQVSYDVCASP